MSTKLQEIPETTEDLVELSNYVTLSRDATLPKIKTQLRTVGDYIMFLFNYTLFNSNTYNISFYYMAFYFKTTKSLIVDEINLQSRVYRWPQEIEQFLDLANNRVIHKKAVVESQLKSKKIEFEFEYVKNNYN